MEEQFVTYEIALKLKELGFDEKCFAIYDAYQDNRLVYLCEDGRNHSGTIKTNASMDFSCLAPLWQQVIDWLFDKYKFIIIERRDYYRNYNGWYYEILKQENEIDVPEELYSHDFNFDTRFEAREAAILKAIELCKERKN